MQREPLVKRVLEPAEEEFSFNSQRKLWKTNNLRGELANSDGIGVRILEITQNSDFLKMAQERLRKSALRGNDTGITHNFAFWTKWHRNYLK